jgi:hypothetical protein
VQPPELFYKNSTFSIAWKKSNKRQLITKKADAVLRTKNKAFFIWGAIVSFIDRCSIFVAFESEDPF